MVRDGHDLLERPISRLSLTNLFYFGLLSIYTEQQIFTGNCHSKVSQSDKTLSVLSSKVIALIVNLNFKLLHSIIKTYIHALASHRQGESRQCYGHNIQY